MENKSQEEIIAALEAQVQALLKQHEEDELRHRKDQERIAYLQELISMRTRTIFAKKAEQSSGGQLSLFDDIELAHCEAVLEEKTEHVKAHESSRLGKGSSSSISVASHTTHRAVRQWAVQSYSRPNMVCCLFSFPLPCEHS